MLKSIFTISTILILTLCSTLQAQDTLTIFMVDQEVTDASEVIIPFSVTNFDAISYFQFSIEWDSTRFSFSELGDFNLDGLDEGRFGISEEALAAGELGLTWLDPLAQSTTLEDTVQIFTLTLNVISDEKEDVEIKFSDDPTAREAGDVNGNEIPVKTIDASITFIEDQSTSVEGFATDLAFIVSQNVPNPFIDRTSIGFHLPKSAEVLFEVFDIDGKQIIRKKSQFPQGENTIELNKLQLNGSGVYQYSLSINQKTITKKLVLIDQ